jgi:DNA-binding MarR family transcriptional regulator
VIEVAGSAPAGRVAELLGMEISTLSRNARIMKDEGWVSIAQAERGNGRILTLTVAGAEKLRESGLIEQIVGPELLRHERDAIAQRSEPRDRW